MACSKSNLPIFKSLPFIDKTIVFDWESVAFLNPFGLIESSMKQFKSIFQSINSVEDDTVLDSLNSVVENIGNMTIDFLQSLSGEEKRTIELVKEKIAENLFLYKDNENILSKYIWLSEFIKWIKLDDSGKLKFQFFSERS